MSEIINQGGPEVTRYYTKCFHCGAGFIYKKNEVHRNAALNRVVGRHGYTGYTGEVHCPGCGTWLPHYEQNIYRTPAVAASTISAASASEAVQAAPAEKEAPTASASEAAQTAPAEPEAMATPDSEAIQAAPVEPEVPIDQETHAPETEAEKQLIPRFCAYCGQPLPSEGSFCGNCGARIR